MSSIFGGSKQKQTSQSSSSSSNQAFPYIQQTYAPVAEQTRTIGSALMDALGLGPNGAAGQQAAFNNYKNSAGYQSALDSGSQAITDNAASRGLLNSGSTGKALQTFGQNLGQQYYQQYLQNLFGAGNMGLQAGSLISGAGNTSSAQSSSSGKSSSKPGLGAFLGTAI